jgi:riboflavin biosynthesis pyrimidine reductase
LLEADLVDELALMIEPIVLGGGKSIFPTDGVARGFELASMQQAGTGVLVCRYQRAR